MLVHEQLFAPSLASARFFLCAFQQFLPVLDKSISALSKCSQTEEKDGDKEHLHEARAAKGCVRLQMPDCLHDILGCSFH